MEYELLQNCLLHLQLRIFLQALDKEVMSEEKVMRLIFVVPRSKFASFEAQEVDEGLGTDKTTPVKQGPRTKVNAKLAQYALAMDFTSADKVPAGDSFPASDSAARHISVILMPDLKIAFLLPPQCGDILL